MVCPGEVSCLSHFTFYDLIEEALLTFLIIKSFKSPKAQKPLAIFLAILPKKCLQFRVYRNPNVPLAVSPSEDWSVSVCLVRVWQILEHFQHWFGHSLISRYNCHLSPCWRTDWQLGTIRSKSHDRCGNARSSKIFIKRLNCLNTFWWSRLLSKVISLWHLIWCLLPGPLYPPRLLILPRITKLIILCWLLLVV